MLRRLQQQPGRTGQVGDYAYVGAGSTITKDIPAKALSVARARQRNIEGWVKEDTYKK